MITRNFNLYLNKTKFPPLCINVNQYDEGEKWVFSLLTVTVSAHSFPYIDIDCELMDAYYGSSNANQYVTFSTNDYITLRSGNNYIAYGNQIEVTPRWYEI